MALFQNRAPKTTPPRTSLGPQMVKTWRLPDASFIESTDADVGAVEVLDPSDSQVQMFQLLQDVAAATLCSETISETLSGFLADWAKGSYTLSKIIQRRSFWTKMNGGGSWRLPVPSVFVTEHIDDDEEQGATCRLARHFLDNT